MVHKKVMNLEKHLLSIFRTAADMRCLHFIGISSTKVQKTTFCWQLNSKEICPLYVFLYVHHSLQMQWKASKACLIIHSHKYVRNLPYTFPSQS